MGREVRRVPPNWKHPKSEDGRGLQPMHDRIFDDAARAYLVAHGDEWDQRRGHGGWDEKAAREYVREGFAMSMIVAGGKVYAPRDGLPAQTSEKA